MGRGPVEHEFGGSHTEIKLDMLRDYLNFFTAALKDQGFELVYIDAFAGTGSRVIKRSVDEAPLLGEAKRVEQITGRGSAALALAADPPFAKLLFIDRKASHFRALAQLRDAHPNRDIQVESGDANDVIRDFCLKTAWRGRGAPGRGRRGVIFLDPYGLHVDFETLRAIAGTKALDVWYLFSLSGLYRQAAHSTSKITEIKRNAITRALGTDEWLQHLYSRSTTDMFGNIFGGGARSADVAQLEKYVKRRLETTFAKVLQPRRIYNDRGAPLFSLFFCMSNPDGPAIGLASRVAAHILKAGISSQVRPRN